MKEIHKGEFVANEIACVGAGIGGGFGNTKELHIMKYKQAMATMDVKQWERAVDEEHDRMVKHRVWQAILIKDIPQAVKIMMSTWAMKKKANGTFGVQLNARGYEQIDGVHYNSHNTSTPVTNDATIWIVLTLLIMAGWVGEVWMSRVLSCMETSKKARRMYAWESLKDSKSTTIPCIMCCCFFRGSMD
jgi:hypothetical protein